MCLRRECLALETDTSLGSVRVIRVLEQIITEPGAPQRIHTDNVPEFTSRCFIAWCLDRRIESDISGRATQWKTRT